MPSPGDAAIPEPYLYVGPWEESRPGDPSFWNVPFGAVLERDSVFAAPDPVDPAATFFTGDSSCSAEASGTWSTSQLAE